MLANFRQAASRAVARFLSRGYDSAAGGRRWEGHRSGFGRMGPETLAAAPVIRPRARSMVANNAWAASGVSALETALIGAGIVPASSHPDPSTRRTLGQLFSAMAERVDVDGLTDLYGIQAAAVRAMVVDGEAFIHMPATAEGLKVRLLPGEMVDESKTEELAGGRRVVAGIEFDRDGSRAAYHVLRERPSDPFSTFGPSVRIPAADMLHLYRPLGAGQVRGNSWLAPVLLRLRELDQLEDALLVGAKVAAMHAGFLTDMHGNASEPYDGTESGGILETGLEPGVLKRLPPGYDIKFSTPQQAQQSVEFAQLQLRAVAAGLGIPEHLLTGDLRNANYSSLRGGLVAFRQHVEQIQFHTIIPQLCRPLYERAITVAILAGEFNAPDFESRAADYLRAEWYPPAQPWVDPLKDQQAEALAVANGFKSRRQVVAAQGYNVEDLDSEIAADHERESSLGLSLNPQTNKPEAENAAANP